MLKKESDNYSSIPDLAHLGRDKNLSEITRPIDTTGQICTRLMKCACALCNRLSQLNVLKLTLLSYNAYVVTLVKGIMRRQAGLDLVIDVLIF